MGVIAKLRVLLAGERGGVVRVPAFDGRQAAPVMVVGGLAVALTGVGMVYVPLAVMLAGVLVALLGVGRMRA